MYSYEKKQQIQMISNLVRDNIFKCIGTFEASVNYETIQSTISKTITITTLNLPIHRLLQKLS